MIAIFDGKGNRVGKRLPMVVGNRYKVFLPPKIYNSQSKSIRFFQEKIVEITTLSKRMPHVFVWTEETPKYGAWLDPDWLFTIDLDGNCICAIDSLMLSGCKCGGN